MTANQSKRNVLNAQIDQFKNSGMFSEEQAEKLIIPLQKELDELVKDMNVKITKL